MIYTITLTPSIVAAQLNQLYGEYYELEITTEMVEELWPAFERFFENYLDGMFQDSLWEDFASVAEEWNIPIFQNTMVGDDLPF